MPPAIPPMAPPTYPPSGSPEPRPYISNIVPSLSVGDQSTPTHNNLSRPSSRAHPSSRGHNLFNPKAASAIDPKFLASSIDFTKTPRSLEISRTDNTILRMPDSTMMFQAQQHLHDMLEDIHEDPRGFTTYITDRRDVMTVTAKNAKVRPVVPESGDFGSSGLILLFASLLMQITSPLNLQTGSLEDYGVQQAVGKGRFSTVFQCTRRR